MPKIENRITLGNIISVITMLIAVLAAFITMQNQTSAHGKTLDDHEQRVRVLENTLTGSLARIDARLSQIEKELSK